MRDAYVIGAGRSRLQGPSGGRHGVVHAGRARDAARRDKRQVKGAEIALAENGGGVIGMKEAVAAAEKAIVHSL
jgi:hypothetical protein